jgi:phospholipase C
MASGGRGRAADRVPGRLYQPACGVGPALGIAQLTAPAQSATPRLSGISKIRHVVILMQENRSFDSFFGT